MVFFLPEFFFILVLPVIGANRATRSFRIRKCKLWGCTGPRTDYSIRQDDGPYLDLLKNWKMGILRQIRCLTQL